MFVNVGMYYDIEASLSDLRDANVDLTGMYVVRRQPEKGQRRFAGRVDRLVGTQVHLLEATESAIVPIDSLKLEASKENFARCLTTLLGPTRYKALLNALDDEQTVYTLGPDFDAVVTKMGAHLAKTRLPIADGVQARVGERIIIQNGDTSRNVYLVPPVDYVFDRTAPRARLTRGMVSLSSGRTTAQHSPTNLRGYWSPFLRLHKEKWRLSSDRSATASA
jgi:hypothetical protein